MNGHTGSMSDRATPAAASRLLVIEDEPAINDVVATALRFQGHTVTQLDDGSAGLSEVLRSA